MAGLTFQAKDFVMNVVSSVTGTTGSLECVFVEVAGMTAAAGDGPVFLAQRIFGVTIMVEGDVLPCSVCVAGLALFAIVPFVNVVLLVARGTLERCWSVPPIGMAVLAGDLVMLSKQGEFRLVVGKARSVLPLFLRMALLARVAQRLRV